MTKTNRYSVIASSYMIVFACTPLSSSTDVSTQTTSGEIEDSTSTTLNDVETVTSNSSTTSSTNSSTNSSTDAGEGGGSGGEVSNSSESGESSGFSSTGSESTGITEFCGDNIKNGNEECDGEELCLNCKNPRYVFVTPPNYQGNFGGIENADSYCQFFAGQDGLIQDPQNQPIYKAWLTDDDSLNQPKFRFDELGFDGNYILVDKTILAEGWEGLTSKDGHKRFIDIQSNGDSLFGKWNIVWTNTNFDGKKVGANTCMNWTYNESDLKGTAGYNGSQNSKWTYKEEVTCDTFGSFYCVQTTSPK